MSERWGRGSEELTFIGTVDLVSVQVFRRASVSRNCRTEKIRGLVPTSDSAAGLTVEKQRIIWLCVSYQPFHASDLMEGRPIKPFVKRGEASTYDVILGGSASRLVLIIGESDDIIFVVLEVPCASIRCVVRWVLGTSVRTDDKLLEVLHVVDAPSQLAILTDVVDPNLL